MKKQIILSLLLGLWAAVAFSQNYQHPKTEYENRAHMDSMLMKGFEGTPDAQYVNRQIGVPVKDNHEVSYYTVVDPHKNHYAANVTVNNFTLITNEYSRKSEDMTERYYHNYMTNFDRTVNVRILNSPFYIPSIPNVVLRP